MEFELVVYCVFRSLFSFVLSLRRWWWKEDERRGSGRG